MREQGILLAAPIEAIAQPLENCPDTTFARQILGPGVLLICTSPKGKQVTAPCSGRVKYIAPAGHAIAVETPEGLQCLIHVGLSQGGRGMRCRPLVSRGASVKAGQPLISLGDLPRPLYIPMVCCKPSALHASLLRTGLVRPPDFILLASPERKPTPGENK